MVQCVLNMIYLSLLALEVPSQEIDDLGPKIYFDERECVSY